MAIFIAKAKTTTDRICIQNPYDFEGKSNFESETPVAVALNEQTINVQDQDGNRRLGVRVEPELGVIDGKKIPIGRTIEGPGLEITRIA